MKSLGERIAKLEDLVSRGKEYQVVMLNTLLSPPTLSFDGKIIELTESEVKDLDESSINALLVRRGNIERDKIKTLIIAERY